MSALQEEMAQAVTPIKRREDELRVELGELNVQKADIYIKQQTQKEQWAEIRELKDAREAKVACLAEGRRLKTEMAKLYAEIAKRTLEIRTLRQKRKLTAQPIHDRMRELIERYPQGTLPE